MNGSTGQSGTPTPMNFAGRLIDVVFDGDHLVIADHNGQPIVVMRALTTAMGLAWQPQHAKLVEKFGSTVMEIVTVAEDGKPRTMICLPLRKLPGWLYSINAGKLAPELRKKVIRYQNECDEVLWQHWTGTYVPQHRAEQAVLTRIELSYEREHTNVCLELSKCTDPGLADALFDKYQRLSGRIGAIVVPIDMIAPGTKQKRLQFGGGAA